MTQETPLEHFLQGDAKSKSLIVFLQGWPDNKDVWEPLDWQNTLSHHRLLFINFPNTSKTQEVIPWGQDFPVIIARIKTIVDAVRALGTFQKVILVAHDWGSTYGYIFDKTYPNYFNEIISLDIPAFIELKGFFTILYVLIYQSTLTIAFLLGGFLGKAITHFVIKVFKYKPKYLESITSANNYPYFYNFRNVFRGLLDKKKRFLSNYSPSVPIVYLYGKKKPIQFHGDRWITYLQSTQGCEIHPMESGHWIMNKFGLFITELINRRVDRK